ncbi:hypothetical protein [Hymenobacter psychrotolerans]|uniref:Uncharacterized protein n=1 Tax=Hymenobacter psychrotolerans DSM 18569 TaxID=1121959 RepID=A0A1M6T4W1_9BACT|nr:hypothetical protein [Hymenobacter psychrotolerans]SHK51950.1 hypothetical protein SAMN02746009_01078 [Hymenobacter psychrotolerans DSM 18569]
MLTAKQDNRLAAAETLLAALRQDPTPYAQDKALQRVVTRLDEIIAGMLPLRQQAQRSGGGGAGTEKQAAREQLARVASEVAGDVFAYATAQKLPTLQALADYNESELLKLRGSRLSDVVTALLAELPTHKATLEDDYDLSKARLQELQDALTAFDTQKTAPRAAQIDGKTARASLRTEFAELGTLLQDQLMRLLRKYQRRAPEFYARIIAARQTVDRPGSATSNGSGQ